MAAISQMRPFPTLPEIFKLDGFLDTITMAGLNMLLRYLTGDDRDFSSNTSKGTMIGWVIADQGDLRADLSMPFIDNVVFLDHIE